MTAVRGIWDENAISTKQRVYFANHNSHGDLALIWTVIPPALREKTRPVAGADYWTTSLLKKFIGQTVFNAVLIDRNRETRNEDPIGLMVSALDAGDSLIIFPEGTRNTGQAQLLPFKSGIYHLAAQRPEIDFIPVWIENLNRVLPKGALVPVPLICTVTFGAPIRLQKGEAKQDFLTRSQNSLLALCIQSRAEEQSNAP